MKMIKKKFITVICLFAFTGLLTLCKTEKNPEAPAETETVKTCFESIGKDTAQLELKTTGHKVTGTLRINLYEKDLNEGTIDGEMKGDTLIADYTFYSEGTSSIREVVFLKKKDQLIEGFGETVMLEGKQVFKNRSTLSFDNSLELTAIECDKK